MKYLFISLSLILIITIFATLNQPEQTQQSSTNIQQEYIITQVSNNEYHGQSTTSNNGIYFTSDYIQSNQSIKEGDTITAHFENELDDSLLYVTK